MPHINKHTQIDALMWDFDGTLANSATKNISVTRQILARVAPRLTGSNLPQCLTSETDYHVAVHGANNWRELYRDFFGMTMAEIEVAGPLWETYQLQDQTPVALFDGVIDTVSRLAHIRQGICSANESRTIRRVLESHGIGAVFQSVIGYEDLPLEAQKPAAEGGLRCLQDLLGNSNVKTVIYVGDHVSDVLFARNLAARLEPAVTVLSIAVTYSGADPTTWSAQPDKVIGKPSDLAAWLTA